MLNKDYVLSRDVSIKQLFYIKYEVMMERLYDFTGPGSVRLSAERSGADVCWRTEDLKNHFKVRSSSRKVRVSDTFKNEKQIFLNECKS